MRQIVIDELSPMETDNIDSFLKRNLQPGPMVGLYWLTIPQDKLGDSQKGHDDCGPFYTAVEMGKDMVRFELLVRSHTNLHCTCIAYATASQRHFILDFIDGMLDEEMIKA
jgi:hypothetical protein